MVKYKLLTLIFLLSLNLAYPQAIYRMKMNVRESSFGTSTCNRVTVVWGIKDDTLCLLIDDKARCYYPLNKKAKLNKDKLFKLTSYADKTSRRGNKHYILQDYRNEVYHVRIISNDMGILIYITCIPHGYPAYVLGFNCSECLN